MKATYTRRIAALLGGFLLATTGVAGLAAANMFDRSSLFSNDLFDDDILCDTSGRSGLANIVSVHSRVRTDSDVRRDVDLDEDDVLLAIALDNNGFGGIDFRDIAGVDEDARVRVSIDQDTDVDRENVLSAIALGVGHVRPRDALACASDISQTATLRTSRSSDIDLDEDTSLLAIALGRNIGGGISFGDIVSGRSSSVSEFEFDSDIDIDRHDALLLLAFG